jgi:opacity protein-like surface antigen
MWGCGADAALVPQCAPTRLRSGRATAADLCPDPGYGVPAAFVPTPSWYVRGDVGYAWMDANDLVANSFTFSSVSVDNTWGLGAGIGIYFGGGAVGSHRHEPPSAQRAATIRESAKALSRISQAEAPQS